MAEVKANLSNGKPKKEIITPSGAGPSKYNAIISQVEYYFGDINLPRDKFLQEEMKKDDGWVPLSTMIKFNRLSKLTTDLDEIAKALQNSDLLEVADDKTKIRRNPETPLPENTLEYWQEIKHRTVYLKGFPQEATLDEIMDFVKQFGEVKNVLMRRTKSENDEPRVFKGSVFATFADVDTAKKLASVKDLKFKETVLVNKMQDQYFVDKKAEIKKKKDAAKVVKHVQKKQIIQEQNISHSLPERVKGSILKVTGFPENIRFDKVKEFFKQYGNPIFVQPGKAVNEKADSSEPQSFYIRFDEENSATKAWEKAVEAGKEGTVVYGEENELKAEVLQEGSEAEDMYWSNYSKHRLAKAEKINDVRNQRKKLRDGGKNQQNRRSQKRSAQGEDTAEQKKAKRTVFADEDAEEDEAPEGDSAAATGNDNGEAVAATEGEAAVAGE